MRHPQQERQTTPSVLVQWIAVTWSKAARGGELAGLRSTVPEALPLPPAAFAGHPGQAAVHRVSFAEHNRFASPAQETLEQVPFLTTLVLGCVSLAAGDGMVSLRYTWQGGAPARRSPGPSGRLAPLTHTLAIRLGQWARIRYNGRFSDMDTGNWWYERHTFNIGFLAEVNPQVFIATCPSEEYSQLADLW